MSKSEAACREVLNYLIMQNRPYSAQDVFQNMGKAYGKTAVVKALEELAQEKKLKEKIYGKQKVYVADQSQFPEPNQDEIKEMDASITKLTEQIEHLQESLRKMDSELRSFSSALSTEEAKTECNETNEKIASLKARISRLKERGSNVSKEDRLSIQKKRTYFGKEWRKRKMMAVSITDAIGEEYPKSKKQLLEEIGVETDEEYNVKPYEV